MFEKYLATEQDLKAIEEALSFVWRKELDFIFFDRQKINSILVISYDAKKLYVWEKKEKNYHLQIIKHNLMIKDEYQVGWSAHLRPLEIEKFLPKKWQKNQFKRPKICGALIMPFLKSQELKKRSLNPYISYESYLVTIIHEFAHIYYNQHKQWWHSRKEENLKYLRQALNLYKSQGIQLKSFNSVNILKPHSFSELYAFCAEYSAASIFWPHYKEKLDQYLAMKVDELLIKERIRDLNIQNSVLDENSHIFAAVIGRLFCEYFPKQWPKKILQNNRL